MEWKQRRLAKANPPKDRARRDDQPRAPIPTRIIEPHAAPQPTPAPVLVPQPESLRIYVPDIDVIIRYNSASSGTMDRLVTIKSINADVLPSGENKARTISGYCYEREGLRTFRCDRIDHFADPKTGEIMASISHLIGNRGTTIRPSAAKRREWNRDAAK